MDNDTVTVEKAKLTELAKSLRDLADSIESAEQSAQQRAATTAWALAKGAEMTTAEIAELVGLSPRAARDLMRQLAKVLPIEREKRVWSAKDKP